MAGTPIQFPLSTAPGANSAESGGRLINGYAEKAPQGSRSEYLWRRSPGLIPEFQVGADPPRGAMVDGSVLYVVNGDTVVSVTKSGDEYTSTALTGTVGGSGPVIMAHNLNATHQILIVHSSGISQVSGSTVSDFSDADLPQPNSICFIDGYFMFGIGNGRTYASGINALTVDANHFASAETSADPLVRDIARGSELLMMGENSIEFWTNTANPTGFPFSRGAVIPIGLLAKWAVAGMEPGWSNDIMFVAADRTVVRLSGYGVRKVSNPDLDRLIEAVEDTTTLEASVFVISGHPCWVLSCDDWTWVYDFSTECWHERISYGAARWRAQFGVNAFGKWIVFDRPGTTAFSLDSRYRREYNDPLVWETRSTQVHRFPQRTICDRAAFDMLVGVGNDIGPDPIETDPKVSISWSDDGGQTFGNALLRRLGSQGEQVLVDVWRTGQTGPKGRQWKLQVSDPVEITLFGGAMFARGTN